MWVQVQAVLQRKEEEDRQMKQLIQALQASLEREKVEVSSLKEQVCVQLPTHSAQGPRRYLFNSAFSRALLQRTMLSVLCSDDKPQKT